MKLRETQFRIALAAAAFWGWSAYGQTPDGSQNALLKGTYNFRHVAVQNVDANNDPSEVTAVYGTITFDGAGNYSVSGTSLDNTPNYSSGPLTATGTYAIGANGLGYITNPLYPLDGYDYIYGAVSQGVFVGSSTEAYDEGYYLNDLFIAIPAGAGQTTATFTSAYQTGVLDFAGGIATAVKNGLFELTPNGKGGLGTITVTGQASNLRNPTQTQTITGGTYAISGGAGTLTIPAPTGVASSSAIFTGTKTFYESADGNFILGWTAGGYDIFFGVKALSGSATNSTAAGLYFTAALEDVPASGGFSFSGTDSYYGGTSDTADTAGDAIVHQRLNFPGYYSEDYGISDQIPVQSNGSASDTFGYNYLFGDGGNAFVAVGYGGYYSLVVGLHAATFSGSGVYLNPIGVVNAASYQPVTASIAPGELLTLFGTGLSSATVTTKGGNAFPTTLNNVQVTIDSIPCPIYYVSPTQISVIAPYGIDANSTSLANIQVTNNNVKSNVVQVYITDVAAGVFSQTANGLGAAAALHAATYQLVTASNPAQAGESLAVYLTGLGTVSPSITDGALGSSTTPLNTADVNTAGNLTVNFDDQTANTQNAATIEYAGLAPGLAGLYQINVQVPTGLGSGHLVTLEFITDYADFDQIQIPYGTASSAAEPVRNGMAVRKARLAKRQNTTKRKSRVPDTASRVRN